MNIQTSSVSAELIELIEQLELLCASSLRTEDARLAVYRLLHSLKSWASLQQDVGLETLCHNLESHVASVGPLTETALAHIRNELPQFRTLFLAKVHNPLPHTMSEYAENLRMVAMPEPLLDARKSGRLRELRASGHVIRMATIWISPAEQMPLARMLLLQSILENHILLYAEAWLWKDSAPISPVDMTTLSDEIKNTEYDGGGIFRCIYANASQNSNALTQLWIDQVETIYHAVISPSRLTESNYSDTSLEIDYPEFSYTDRAAQRLFLHLQRFMPGIRGMSVNAYLSYESSWKQQLLSLHEVQALNVSEYIQRLITHYCELPWNTNEGGKGRVEWRVYTEQLFLSEQVLHSLGQIIGQLIRNSIAHGQESETLRVAQQKNPAMRIHVALFVDDESLVLQFSDDGKGIDPAQIIKKSGESYGELPTDADILTLISQPGFSTKEEIEKNAGRGMGLHIVAHEIRSILRGTWALENDRGAGTQFILKFPRNLFALSVMVCEGTSGTCAIPRALIEGIHSLSAGTVDCDTDSTWHIRIGGRKMPLIHHEIALHENFEGLQGVVIQAGAHNYRVIPVQKIEGIETVLVEAGSEAAYIPSLSKWVTLRAAEI